MINTCDHCCTRIDRLNVRFGREHVLRDVELHVNCGELIAVVGPNGAGKTTLLRAILGEIPYTGSIRFQVKGKPRKHPLIGYVPQKLHYDASSPITVSDLMTAAITRRPVWSGLGNIFRQGISSALMSVASEGLIDRKLGTLSGGELQRVMLAMAMVPKPDILLLDEPMSGVDAKGLSFFYDIVDRLKKDNDVAVLLVTHDLLGIAKHSDRMILINKGIVAAGRPEEVLADKKLLQLLGPSLWNVSKVPDIDGGEARHG